MHELLKCSVDVSSISHTKENVNARICENAIPTCRRQPRIVMKFSRQESRISHKSLVLADFRSPPTILHSRLACGDASRQSNGTSLPELQRPSVMSMPIPHVNQPSPDGSTSALQAAEFRRTQHPCEEYPCQSVVDQVHVGAA